MTHPGTSRRLATILAADVVGYSRLMALDEEATVRTLKAHREIIDRLIARHEGRIFNTAGDSVLAEFGSAVEAVRCAVTIQDELRVRNAELVEARQMLFRVGVNIGDVIADGDDLLGDGINVAARLESIAPAGGICISGSTFEQVKNKLSIGFVDLGPQAVKNIPDPVAAFRLTTAPVSVSDANGEETGEETTAIPAPKRSPGVLAMIVVVVIGLGLTAAWLFWDRGPTPPVAVTPSPPMVIPEKPATAEPAEAKPPAAPARTVEATPQPPAPAPKAVSTRDLIAVEIADMMAGMTIRGIRRKDGMPFTIVLHEDKTTSYAFPRPGIGTGTTFRATGSWWTKDGRFCMQQRGWNQGEPSCPRFTLDDGKLTASRPDDTPLAWTMTPSASGASITTPPSQSTSSDDMLAAQIQSLMAGRTIHGSRKKDDRPFTIVLASDGTATVEMKRPNGSRFLETGKWWGEDFHFCMRFKKFNNGQELCPRIVITHDRLSMTKGDGSLLPWTLKH